jgi:hypothetical protein
MTARYNIPVHPQPSIFETTIGIVENDEGEQTPVTHTQIEEILARPKWTFDAAMERVIKQMRKTHRLKPLPGAGGGKVFVPKTPKV